MRVVVKFPEHSWSTSPLISPIFRGTLTNLFFYLFPPEGLLAEGAPEGTAPPAAFASRASFLIFIAATSASFFCCGVIRSRPLGGAFFSFCSGERRERDEHGHRDSWWWGLVNETSLQLNTQITAFLIGSIISHEFYLLWHRQLTKCGSLFCCNRVEIHLIFLLINNSYSLPTKTL